MRDIFKHLGKFLGQGLLWVFLLSIHWDGKTLYAYCYDVFVDNSLVHTVDTELGEVWYKLVKTAKVTFSEPLPEELKM
jgi:hypothetical protein